MQNQERVREIVADTLGVSVLDIVPDADFKNDLGASLDYCQIFMACEEEFGITICDADMVKLRTLRLLVAHIDEKLQLEEIGMNEVEKNDWPPPPHAHFRDQPKPPGKFRKLLTALGLIASCFTLLYCFFLWGLWHRGSIRLLA